MPPPIEKWQLVRRSVDEVRIGALGHGPSHPLRERHGVHETVDPALATEVNKGVRCALQLPIIVWNSYARSRSNG